MFIDELAKTYLRLEKIKLTLNTVSKKQEKAIKQLNQDVYITDLIVRSPFAPFGESSSHTKHQISSRLRLQAFIAILFGLANEYHQELYCEKDSRGFYHLKKEKKNHVTRLSTHEFSLYTKKPLTLNKFQLLLNDIEKMADNLTPNVHILLSSFAVQNNNGTLFNMSLFIEGGSPSRIHAFSKNTASSEDIYYKDVQSLFSQQQDQMGTFHADEITSEDGITISTGSVFEVKTKGGACYTQAIDICLDHELQHSKELITRRLLTSATPDELFPNQIEQCISSNTIHVNEDSLISDSFLHVDRNTSMRSYGATMGSKLLTDTARRRIIPIEYPNTRIIECSFGYQIIYPPFGSEYFLEVFSERPAGKYRPEFQSAVNQHNQKVLERQVAFLKQESLGNKEVDKLVLNIDKSTMLLHWIEQLEKGMLKRCKPTVLQEIFKTEEYKQKLEAKEVISDSMKLMKDAIRLKGNASVLLLRAWKEGLGFRLDSIGSLSVQSPLKKALKKDIKEIIDNKLQKELGCEFEPPKLKNNSI